MPRPNSSGLLRETAFSRLFLVALTFTLALSQKTAAVEETDLFASGVGGYHTYRIPSLVATNAGSLLAFCEGRTRSASDSGNIDVLLRRSSDGGKTWSDAQVVWDDGPNSCGNPCAVVDRQTGAIWLLLTWNAGNRAESKIQPGYGKDSRRVFVTSSTDDGKTWATPREITAHVKQKTWTWYATGPGAGIQLQHGAHRGRLVIPCDHKTPRADGVDYNSHVIYSDDHGKSWQLGGSAPRNNVNECETVELSDGRLLLNMRCYPQPNEPLEMRTRQVCLSSDGGATWHDQRYDPALIEPTCQASIRRCRSQSESLPGVILFSNPASQTKRERLTIRASYDDAQTWGKSRVLYEGPSAYSCLCVVDPHTILCLYEKDGYQQLTAARFSLEWLEQGETNSGSAPAQPNSED